MFNGFIVEDKMKNSNKYDGKTDKFGIIVENKMKNSNKYDGKTDKFGIIVENINYIVKLPKETITSVYSEHLASRFILGLGIPCHETWLGYYKGEQVVIMKDFTSKGVKLRSYKSTNQSSEETSITDKKYTYTDVLNMINKHTKMSAENKRKAVIRFWDMFICDAILGNRDRYHGNWGYLTSKDGYVPAPIYDNGASLFPDIQNRIQEYIKLVNENKEYVFIEQRAEKFPASLFQLERADGSIKRTNYYEILSDLRFNKTLAQEVKIIKEKIGFNKVYEIAIRNIADTKEIIPVEYRRFYLIIICVRYLHMIERKSIKDAYIITKRRLDNEIRQW